MAKLKKKPKAKARREGVTDFHLHIQPWKMFKPEALAQMRKRRPDMEDILRYTESPKEFLKHLDDCGIERACLVNYVSPDVIGFTHDVNDWISKYCSVAPDRLIAVGSIHPRFMSKCEEEMDRLCGDLGIRVIKIHPPHQLIYPNDYRQGLHALGAIYRKAQEYRVPVMIHTGTSVFPGARNKYGQPMYCDDIGVDFPDLRVILAHGGRPLWMEECFFLVRRHPNFYIDLSGIPMTKILDYFPRIEDISEKVLWGTDWPGPAVPDLKENLTAFESLPIRADVKERILVSNSRALIS